MYRLICLTVAISLVAGCDLIFPNTDEPGPVGLKRFESAEELSTYLRDQITARNQEPELLFRGVGDFAENVALFEADSADGAMGSAASGAVPMPDSSSGAGGASGGLDAPPIANDRPRDDFSQTTTQEQGVAEADVVKTDGTHLYIISGEVLRIVQAAPLAELSQTPLEGFGREIYLHGQRILAITQTYGGYQYIDAEPFIIDMDGVAVDEDVEPRPDSDIDAPDFVYQRPKTHVTIIDVSDPQSPRIESRTTFDGSPVSSRMIDDMLRLVLANHPYDFLDIMPHWGQPAMNVAEIDVESLLPHFEQVDSDGAVSNGQAVTWRTMFRPIDPDGFGMVTVVSLDITAPSQFKSVGVVADPSLVYSSTEALYVTDSAWSFFGTMRSTTDIYKFRYTSDSVVPAGAGSVPGRILNQYSMGEYDGYLRVATTVDAVFTSFGRSEPTNNVYVLEETAEGLDVVGSITNIAPGETIQSARFMGSRGYLVTFEQIDPLFTLDLSDPRRPAVIGELKVPGFSTFIVPMDANHLLTIGEYIPEDGPRWISSVQMSIFDITDFANPVLEHNVIIGGELENSYSEALHDPKAFTYFAEEGLIALPVSIYPAWRFIDDVFIEPGFDGDFDDNEVPGEEVSSDSGDSAGSGDADADSPPAEPDDPPADDDAADGAPVDPFEDLGFDGLAVFSVSAADGFAELGRLSTRFEGYYWSPFTRGVFIGDDVYAITANGVRTAPILDMDADPAELVFEIDGDGLILPLPAPGGDVADEGDVDDGDEGADG